MGYYAIVASAYTGHLNPITVLARELRRRGHRIAVVAPLDARAKVEQSDLEFHPMATKEFPAGRWDQDTARMGTLTGYNASRFVGRWLGRLTRGILRELPEIVARERFDGLVMDQICLGTESVCAKLELPLAVAACALTLHAEPGVPPMTTSWPYRRSPAFVFHLRNLAGLILSYSTGWPVTLELIGFRRKHRLPRLAFNHMNVLAPSLVQVAQQPAFFDFPRRHLPDHFHYTGPWLDRQPRPQPDDAAFPWERLDGRPIIYASMGTLQNRLDHAFRIIAEACAGFEAQLVLALGSRSASVAGDWPGHPIVVGYAPQLELLRRASLVITHGGLNTTLESLSQGLPMVVLPIANDQPGIAARVAHLGIGQFIPIKKLSTARLRHAVAGVLNTPSYRARCAEYASELRRLNGPAMAADLIESAFSTRQRVYP